ncbi:Cro/CI family transcriptional regulator [Serratia rubidaea]|uniref:Cro/CI family transcriptional regulator n=1 Tax=Serratia rubidaea TaxID=61652 RepID=UPI001783708D|nr:Cro/CI family transcriptional regulator [Serratia rubidaea]MBD8451846.1 helix-turn-helix domain-containing protein [Serratia rubidaea]MDC6118722.1 Cro/CI family transcriptional regulator [Serratia rubidaea]
MLTDDAVKFFGNKTKLAEAAGVSQASVSRWGERVPERRAARLDRLTGGELAYEPAVYQEPKSTNTD